VITTELDAREREREKKMERENNRIGFGAICDTFFIPYLAFLYARVMTTFIWKISHKYLNK